MNFPLKGDIKFLKNLKKGTPLYLCEAEWDPLQGDTKITVKTIFFDHYDTRKVGTMNNTGDEGPILGILSDKKGRIQTGVHDLRFGFFETPMQAMESIKVLYTEGLKAIDKAINKENKRLEKLAKKMVESAKNEK